jgi:hypothetical protein
MVNTTTTSDVSSTERKRSPRKPTSSTSFNILTDQQSESESGYDRTMDCSNNSKARFPLPLSLTGVNSRMVPLSRPRKNKQTNKEESDDDGDKENCLVDDEAEEDSAEESEECSNEELEITFGGRLQEESSDESRSLQRSRLPRCVTSHDFPTRYSQSLTDAEDTESEDSEADESDSLDGFIVSDNEGVSYHESSDSLPDDNELDKTSPARRPRRRLFRGRNPEGKEGKTRLENNDTHSKDSFHSQPSRPKPHEDNRLPKPGSTYPPLFPKEHIEDKKRYRAEMNGVEKSDNTSE